MGHATAKQPVQLITSEKDDLILLNGCVITASRYLASVRALHVLEKDFWSRMLLVRFKGFKAGHAYCVWELDGHLFGYDKAGGAFEIPNADIKNPVAIAQSLGRSMEQVLETSVVVERAEFINPANATVSAY